MELQLITNPDHTQRDTYYIARVVYAETGGTSLRVVEAMCSMIFNLATKAELCPYDVVHDCELFTSQKSQSPRHNRLTVSADNRAFQMCLRTTRRMLRGNLQDACFGATRFHHEDVMPSWAIARGYIADIDGILFYL